MFIIPLQMDKLLLGLFQLLYSDVVKEITSFQGAALGQLMACKRTCAQALPLSSCNFTTSCQSGQLNDPDQPMIQCTSCNKWFHFKCVCLDFTHDLKDTDFIVRIVQHNC